MLYCLRAPLRKRAAYLTHVSSYALSLIVSKIKFGGRATTIFRGFRIARCDAARDTASRAKFSRVKFGDDPRNTEL